MIQIIRRSSNAKYNDRWYEHFMMLNKIVCENSKANLRDSVDPLQGMSLIFKVIKEDMLSRQFLESILKNTEKDTLTVGFILPRELLIHFYETLVGRPEQRMDQKSLFGTFVEHNQNMPVNAFYLFLEEEEGLGERKPDIQQKFIYGFCSVWVVTENFSRQRVGYWEDWEEIFQKKSNLFLIKDSQQAYPADLSQKMETIFWHITHYRPETQPLPKAYQSNIQYLTVKTGYRQAYRQLPEETVENQQFPIFFASFAKQVLKTNYKYITNVCCVPVVYFLCCWLKDEQRNQKQHLQLCMNGYFKYVEEEFCKFVNNIHLPMDELKLRAGVSAEKKEALAGVKRQMNMFMQLFEGVDNVDKYFDNLARLLTDKEEDIYRNNTRRATFYNEDLIAKLYNEIITTKFDDGGASDRPHSEYKADFRAFLDCYGSQSIRTTTQLKTFNQFIMARKIEYTEALEKEIQGSKKRYISEKDELKDRLQIQMGVLNTLEEEIRQLEDQRIAIEDQNQSMKKDLTQLRNKATGKQFYASSPSRNPAETKLLRKQAKTALYRTAKIQMQREKSKCCSCCCCSVM